MMYTPLFVISYEKWFRNKIFKKQVRNYRVGIYLKQTPVHQVNTINMFLPDNLPLCTKCYLPIKKLGCIVIINKNRRSMS